jgi:hypothetical protein
MLAPSEEELQYSFRRHKVPLKRALLGLLLHVFQKKEKTHKKQHETLVSIPPSNNMTKETTN